MDGPLEIPGALTAVTNCSQSSLDAKVMAPKEIVLTAWHTVLGYCINLNAANCIIWCASDRCLNGREFIDNQRGSVYASEVHRQITSTTFQVMC